MELSLAALASDYDATLATDSKVGPATLAALQRLKASGRRLIMVTGRELPDLKRVFPQVDVFDAVVAENGALLWRPGEHKARRLGPPPPPAFVAALRRAAIAPLNVGEVIVATGREHEQVVRTALAACDADWQVILNKDSLMCLPPGLDKASGLAEALSLLGLGVGETLGVGDAENDLPFLEVCGVAAAVENALPDVKAAADVVTEGAAGAGVAWLIDALLDGRLDGLIAGGGLRRAGS